MKIIATTIPMPKSAAYTEENLSKSNAGRKTLQLIREGIKEKMVINGDMAEKFSQNIAMLGKVDAPLKTPDLTTTLEKYLKHEAKEAKKGTCFGQASVVMTTFTSNRSEKSAVKKANIRDVIAFQIIDGLRAKVLDALSYFKGLEKIKNDKEVFDVLQAAAKALYQRTIPAIIEAATKFLARVEKVSRDLIERKTKLKFNHVKKFSKDEKDALLTWLKSQTKHSKHEKVFRIGIDSKQGGHTVALFLKPGKKFELYDSAQGFIKYDDQKELLKQVKKAKMIDDGMKISGCEIEIFKPAKA
jgi:hypothetical protein